MMFAISADKTPDCETSLRRRIDPTGINERRSVQQTFVGVLGAALLAMLTPAFAQSMPDAENGRFTLAPVPDGVARLDTRNGVMSICNNTGAGWACHVMPEERAAFDTEIGRLQHDNDRLKAQLAQRDAQAAGKIDRPMPKEDSLKRGEAGAPESKPADSQRKLELVLPSDRDVDRVMAFVERAWRRLVEMANRMQRDFSGKI